jgi:membrane fusion protein (multidrug efflux system)
VNGGARVHLYPEAGDKEYGMTGKLLFSDMTVDPTTGSITLRAEFPNPKRTAVGHLRARQDRTGCGRKALTVPQRALIRSAQGASVLVVGDDGRQPRCRSTRRRSAIAGGDRRPQGWRKVIVEGLQKVRPGAPAKAVPFQNPQTAAAPASARAQGAEGGKSEASNEAKPAEETPASKADRALPEEFHGEVFHRPAGVRVGARADHRAGRALAILQLPIAQYPNIAPRSSRSARPTLVHRPRP